MSSKIRLFKRLSFFIGGVGLASWSYLVFQKQLLRPEQISLNEQEIQEITKKESGFPLKRNKDRKRVVIIGGGVMGITTAFYLLESQKYDVVLLEKNQMVSQETSFKNGCIFCPCLSDPWINEYVPKYFLKSLLYKDFAIGIYKEMFKDLFCGVWILNVLPNIISSRVEVNRDKLQNLAKISDQELKRLFSSKIIDPVAVDSHTQGNLTLYEKLDQIGPGSFHKKIKRGYLGEILENEQIFEKEKCLKSSNVDRYKAAALIYGDTNLNIYKFDAEIVKYLKAKYPENFTILTGTSHKAFLVNINSNGKIVGVKTNKGELTGDHFIVTAGNFSKEICKQLGFRIPMIPVKGHALSVPVDPKNPLLTYNVTNDATKIYLTQIAGIYRLSGAADFQGMDYQINEKRVSQLKDFLAEMIGGNPDFDKAEGWCCLRPVTSDDVPIVSRLPGYENLYLNAGHGSKGLTLALGSGVLMRDLLEGKQGTLKAEDFSLTRFYFV